MKAPSHPKVQIICKVCHSEKMVFYADTIRRNVLYCSKKCSGLARRKDENFVLCVNCKSPFRVRGHRRFDSKKLYCSMKCYGLSQRRTDWKYDEQIALRKSPAYRKFRMDVFRRDNFTCQDCGVKSGNGFRVELCVDHIKPWALFPELRFEPSNGRTLCRECHLKTSTYGKRLCQTK